MTLKAADPKAIVEAWFDGREEEVLDELEASHPSLTALVMIELASQMYADRAYPFSYDSGELARLADALIYRRDGGSV